MVSRKKERIRAPPNNPRLRKDSFDEGWLGKRLL
jgi:hypothetical protein